MKRYIPLAALAGLLLSLTAGAETKKLTLLVTGDNRGEVTQCGCTNIPTGGLARRKTRVEEVRAKGPVLLLDSGNALFREEHDHEASSKVKAGFILQAMGEMGTAAMTVGPRDLEAGPEFLKSTARKANVKLLSANLTLKGKRVFEPSTVVTVGETRVGLVGVGPAVASFEHHPGLVGTAPGPAVLAEASKLKDKVDVVVVLAALPLTDALQLSKEVGESVHLIFQSGDARSPGVPQQGQSNFLISTGRRGQMLASVELDLSGTGPLVDRGQLERDKQALLLLEQRIAEARKKGAQESLKGLEERKAQVMASMTSLQGRTGRSLLLSPLLLGPDVADEPGLKARVDKLLPPESGEKRGKDEPASEP